MLFDAISNEIVKLLLLNVINFSLVGNNFYVALGHLSMVNL